MLERLAYNEGYGKLDLKRNGNKQAVLPLLCSQDLPDLRQARRIAHQTHQHPHALIQVNVRITRRGIMGLWRRQPSPKHFVGCGDFVCHVECTRKLLEALVWLNKDD